MSYDRLYDIKVDFTKLVKQKKSLVHNEYRMLKKLRDGIQEPSNPVSPDVINYSIDGRLSGSSCSDTKNMSKQFERCFVLVTRSPRMKWSKILELRQGSYNKVEIVEHLIQMVGVQFNRFWIFIMERISRDIL